ncbi:zinc finger protein 226-like isoform X16 [Harpegnathos saltator]|uniref:zinc finger protein 226-like isoform X16 n=1 Tax=Harpegnathos saltator TaxID=610380 RepID=UPI000DBEE234|nr:zinc finger protein 226-like isoform X16 [Harpegnathos saltator]
MSSADCSDLCRLCLVKERVTVPIFEGEGDARRIFTKISTCLPVKISREDKLPQKLCADCVYKVETFFEFWQTTAVSEKRLQAWLADVEKQDYAVATVLNQSGMKGEQSNENRLDGSGMMQQVSGHQNSLNMVMDNMGMCMSMMMPNNQQQITSVPMDPSGSSVQSIQVVAGSSTHEQITHDQIIQNQTNAPTQQEEEEESSEDEENSDDECDGDGLPIKEESEEDPNNSRTIEPTTFVNVSLACEDPGPSGLQQQKMADIQEMTTAGDPKTGCDEIIVENAKLQTIDELRGIELMRFQDDDVCVTEEYRDIDHQEIVTDTTELEDVKLETALETHKADIGKQFGEGDSNRRHKTVYECDICGKRMLKKQLFLKHMQSHEGNAGRCDECDRAFADEEKLQKHMIKVHQQERPFQCVLCNKCFKTKEFLKTHLKQHNKRFTCDICGISKVSGYDLRLHKKKHNQEYVTHCEICGKGFYTNQTLDRHLLTHTGEKPFVCKICNTPYASAAYLNMHMKSHGEREKHRCTICNFESYWKAALKVHLKIHTGENQITCEVCGKSVSSKTYLQIHMRIHSGEKPHVCEVCGKAFSVRKYLIVHLRTHTGERPYECKVCHKRFTQQGSLNSHMKSHNESK